MNRKLKFAFGAMRALVGGLCLSGAALAQTLPDGKGKAEFVHNCTACHSTGMVLHAKKTPAEWRKNVDDMAARGTDGSKEDIDNVVLYLDTYFATDNSGPAAETQSVSPSSSSGKPAVFHSSESERAKRVISESACLACHRMEKQGAYTGPTLNGIGGRRTVEEIRSALIHPHPILDPSNRLVRLITADGKTVNGRVLTQTDRDVQVIVGSGGVATYSKAELRQFTVVNANPMPSYQEKISEDDLDVLARYLGTLPSVDESAGK